MLVVKKIQQVFFEAVITGKKKSEFRLDDFEVQEGDILRLIEVDTNKKETGRSVEKVVTYVSKVDLNNTYWPVEEILEKGIQVISFE